MIYLTTINKSFYIYIFKDFSAHPLSYSQLHGSKRRSTGSGLGLGKSLFIDISTLLGSSEVGLDLSVLGEVEGGNLLGLLNLFLVGLDLALELVNQTLHALVILPVLLLGVGQLLDLTLGLAEVLLAVSVASVLSIKLRLKLTDASVHSGHCLLASLEGVGVGLVNSGLHILDLGLQQFLLSLQSQGELLLRSKFISKTSSINHGTLGLLLGQRSLTSHLVTVSLEGLDLRLQLHLCSLDGLVGALELLLHHTASTVSLLQESAGLLKSILVGVGLALSIDQFVMSNLLDSLLILQLGLGLSQLELVVLDGSLGVSIGSIGTLQVALQIKNISLELLLHSQSFSLGLALGLNSGLHVLNALGHVLLGAHELLVLLSHAAVNLLSDLGQLQLASQDLVLLLFKGSLSLGQSRFKLHLLSLKTSADFVNLVDGASSLTNLVHDVLDLIGQGLVLTSDLIKLEDGLLVGRLDTEQFRGGVAGLLLGIVKIHANAVNLLRAWPCRPCRRRLPVRQRRQ